jgi:hypothetical protein
MRGLAARREFKEAECLVAQRTADQVARDVVRQFVADAEDARMGGFWL